MSDHSETPLVSICSITYNHVNFIRQALDGFLMQATSFPVEIIIHDDASTDGTAEIIREYQACYPDKICAILQQENQRSFGKRIFSFTSEKARGKYIALCEGDDYWISAKKLQTQVEFLEQHPNCSACFHDTQIVFEDKSQESRRYCQNLFKEIYCFEDLLVTYIMHTSASMFRRSLVRELPPWITPLKMLDWPLHILLSLQGPIGYIDQVMSVYRIHQGGIWSGSTQFSNRKAVIQMFGALSANLEPHLKPLVDKRLVTLLDHTGAALIEQGISENSSTKSAVAQAEDILVKEILPLLSSIQDLRKFKGGFYKGMGFACYQNNKLSSARYCLYQSIRYNKDTIRDRGVWSIGLETLVGVKIANQIRTVNRKLR